MILIFIDSTHYTLKRNIYAKRIASHKGILFSSILTLQTLVDCYLIDNIGSHEGRHMSLLPQVQAT